MLPLFKLYLAIQNLKYALIEQQFSWTGFDAQNVSTQLEKCGHNGRQGFCSSFITKSCRSRLTDSENLDGNGTFFGTLVWQKVRSRELLLIIPERACIFSCNFQWPIFMYDSIPFTTIVNPTKCERLFIWTAFYICNFCSRHSTRWVGRRRGREYCSNTSLYYHYH